MRHATFYCPRDPGKKWPVTFDTSKVTSTMKPVTSITGDGRYMEPVTYNLVIGDGPCPLRYK